MLDPTRLAISLLTPEGSVASRWGPDEEDVGDIPRGLGFSTSDPGGFKDATVALARAIDDRRGDLALLRDVRIYGAGDRTAWEGRLQETPRREGDDFVASPGAVGHVVELDDDPSFAEIYIDRELSKWGEPTTARRLALAEAGLKAASGTATAGGQDAGTSGPGITMEINHLQQNALVESWYYGNGVPIGEVRYSFDNVKGLVTPASWTNQIAISDRDILPEGTFDLGANHQVTDAANQAVLATTATRKYVRIRGLWFAPAETADNVYMVQWLYPRVFGRHGLTKRGAAPLEGFWGCDVIANIVTRCAPRLQFTTGPEGTIRDSDFPIPHLAFDGVKGSDAVLATNAFHQRFWGVYDDKTFFWLPTTTYRKRWRIRRSSGHGIDLLGPQAEDAVNGVVVSFTDPSGQTRVVTPPGVSSAYATSPLLADTSETNPVNAAGIARKWGSLQLDFVTDLSGAVQVAAAWLQVKLENANSRGSVTVSGMVEDDATGALYPAWYMRAGDSAIVTDGDNVERRIIETNYEHDSRTVTCNMDSTPHKVDALMERMGVVLVGIVD